MDTRMLGSQEFTVSSVGLGCMGMSQGYGPTDDALSLSTLRKSLALGVTFWDTAQSYGAGHNERLLGRALAGCRDEVQLATKFGIVRDDAGVHLDGRPAGVKAYCEASLRRLGTDYIDLYYLHRIDPGVPVEETIGAMVDLISEGKIRHIGLSECDAAQLERAVAVHPIAALQLEWSLWWREPEDDVIPAARRLGVGVVPYSPLGRGFLAGSPLPTSFGPGDFRSGDARFVGPAMDRNQDAFGKFQVLSERLGVSPAQLALAWLMHQGADVVPIPGTRHADRVAENAAAGDIQLTAGDLEAIESTVGRAEWAGDRRSFAAFHTQRTPL